ncbi:metallophosphoesterase [Phycisphaerales bacterium AB-hyl4]|uniref:Metallophosphoesterase n=1 Tax=Natronomicrosphaera hydrolytica TaxID=3242702 RepID=A0ABV4U478_9BACT
MPRIGLLSDSHGRAKTTRLAVEVLLSQEVDLLVHLGDVGTVEVIDALAGEISQRSGQPIEAHLVFGNTDWDTDALARYARELGVHVDDPVGRLPVEQGTLVFCHGHQADVLHQAIAEQVRYLCHGHTHRTLDQRQGSTRVINPGALFRAQRYTVAVLDTADDELTFYPVGGS